MHRQQGIAGDHHSGLESQLTLNSWRPQMPIALVCIKREAPMVEMKVLLNRRFGVLAVLFASLTGATAWTSPAWAEKRFFTVLAVEQKGGTTVDKEPFPTGPLPPGQGYVIAPPDEKTRRWEVSAYVWQPSQIIVNEGDEVTLEFVGINGAAHPTSIAAFDQTFAVKRGQ